MYRVNLNKCRQVWASNNTLHQLSLTKLHFRSITLTKRVTTLPITLMPYMYIFRYFSINLKGQFQKKDSNQFVALDNNLDRLFSVNFYHFQQITDYFL